MIIIIQFNQRSIFSSKKLVKKTDFLGKFQSYYIWKEQSHKLLSTKNTANFYKTISPAITKHPIHHQKQEKTHNLSNKKKNWTHTKVKKR